jgi:hypothetical protein
MKEYVRGEKHRRFSWMDLLLNETGGVLDSLYFSMKC